MVRTQIQLTEEQAQRLKSLAAKRGKSMAALIRIGVDQLLNNTSLIDTEEQRRRAIAAAGKYHSGQKDIAVEHDKYLTQDFE